MVVAEAAIFEDRYFSCWAANGVERDAHLGKFGIRQGTRSISQKSVFDRDEG